MSQYILGIDSGLTVTKAVVFDQAGRTCGTGSTRVPHSSPHPRWVERDMDELWAACAHAIRSALAAAGISGRDIAAVGATGHGDGLYLVDGEGRPVRPAILSLDSRAHVTLEGWRQTGLLDQALPLTGQQPFSGGPAALLGWLLHHEPESVHRARWMLYCKDWIKFRLTGQIATDPTEASVAFTNVRTQAYDPAAFRVYGLEAVLDKAPPVVGSADIMGEVTPEAAAATGLAAGTPVVSGLHDVDAGAVGIGCIHPGQLCLIAGTFSINEVISTAPATDPRWLCRNFVEPGRWMNMALSPASATNLEWFVRGICPLEAERAARESGSAFAFVGPEVAAVLQEEFHGLFLPFLYGSPHGDLASAALIGLRGWHTRGHLLRAIFEGVCFNHRTHVDALRSAFPLSEARLTGGGARSEIWSQMFADTLGLAVRVTDVEEAGALGTALCAGLGAGLYRSLDDAVAHAVRVTHSYEPDPGRHAQLARTYDLYMAAVQALNPVWSWVE